MSFSVSSMRSPILFPLLRIDRWVKLAALGMDVVPEVNWMLTISSASRFAGRRLAPSLVPKSSSLLKSRRDRKG